MLDERDLAFAIIGCGLAGKNRVASIPEEALLVACDHDLRRAEAIAARHKSVRATTNSEEAISDPNVRAVIVSTPHSSLASVALSAVRAGKHVLVEKPGATSSTDLMAIQAEAGRTGALVRIGFNHRYHPAFQKAYELVRTEKLGDLMFIRGRYGHGGRLRFNKEWRAEPSLSGGGELLDQGVHLIDLAASFLGDFSKVEGHTATYFWDMAVEDNVFLSLRTATNQTAWLHASYTEWKNLFSFEMYFRNAKLHIEGLGSSYGVERLYYYRMLPEMGPPETIIFEYPQPDSSWTRELTEFREDIALRRTPSPGLKEGIQTLKIVEQIYQMSRATSTRF